MGRNLYYEEFKTNYLKVDKTHYWEDVDFFLCGKIFLQVRNKSPPFINLKFKKTN